MHSIELILDDHTDALVREQWQMLVAADLPSQARHTGASNRPHITVALAETLSDTTQQRLAAALSELPLPITIGGLLVFGSRSFVLARLAVPSTMLLDLQAEVSACLDDPVDPHRTFEPGRWTPHVTLARRLTAGQVGQALTVLGEQRSLSGVLPRARRWDMGAKVDSWIGS